MLRVFRNFASPLSFIICLSLVISFLILMDSIKFTKVGQPTPFSLDTTTLLNLSRFTFLINNDVCADRENSNEIRAIIIVTSHAGNIDVRQAHRNALPKGLLLELGIRRVFLLAVASENKIDGQYKSIKQGKLIAENEINHDLIQGNFDEAYRNLTYKHIMGLHWVSKFCAEANYVIKMDDDIILDIFMLLKLIQKEAVVGKPFLLGYVLRGMKPIRDPTNKWYVSPEEYPKSFYPPFLSGWMYVTTTAVVSKLVDVAAKANVFGSLNKSHLSFFWIDDVYVTGILAHQAKVLHIDLSRYFAVHPQYFQCCVEEAIINRLNKSVKHEQYPCEFVVGPSGGDMKLLQKVIKEAENCWSLGHLCHRNLNSTRIDRTCIVGRGEAFDWIRRPFSKGKAVLKAVSL